MNFNREIFKRHFGKPYINTIKGLLAFDLICVVLIIVFFLMSIQPPFLLAAVTVGMPLFSLLIFFPILFSYYWRALKQSERQKQWIEEKEIHVLLVPDNGFVWGAGMVRHTKEYVIHAVRSMNLTTAYLIIKGDITLIENDNGCIETKMVDKCKIPRNFTNEESLLQLGGEV